MIKKIVMLSVLSLLINGCFAQSQQIKSTDKESGIMKWTTDSNGVYISFQQVPTERSDAFYLNRGFRLDQIAKYSQSCIFLMIMRNDSAPDTIHFVRDNWLVKHENKQIKLPKTQQWMNEFEQSGIKQPALLAFRWSQFPSEQEYAVGGDWNEGMLSIGLPALSQFDLTIHWDIHGQAYETTLNEVKCAQ